MKLYIVLAILGVSVSVYGQGYNWKKEALAIFPTKEQVLLDISAGTNALTGYFNTELDTRAGTNKLVQTLSGDETNAAPSVAALNDALAEKVSNDPDSYVPAVFYATPGYELNIYHDNAIYGDWNQYYWDAQNGSFSGVTQLAECWRYTVPTNQAATNMTLNIRTYDRATATNIFSSSTTVYVAQAVYSNAVTTSASCLKDTFTEAATSIGGYGEFYVHTGKFNQVLIPGVRASTNVGFAVDSVECFVISAATPNRAGVTNGTVIGYGRADVDAQTVYTNIVFDLNTTIHESDVPNYMFVGYRGLQTDTNHWAGMGRAREVLSNRDPVNTSFWTYTSTSTWAKTEWTLDPSSNAVCLVQNYISNLKVLFIGDSTGATAGSITDQLALRSSSDPNLKITLLGTQPRTNECVASKSWNYFYTNSASAFTDGTNYFNLTYYLTGNGYADPDYILFHLGLNSLTGYQTDAQVATTWTNDLTYINAMIANITNHSANIKIGLCPIIPPAYSQDGAGYSSGSTVPNYNRKRSCVTYANLMCEQFKNRTNENIYIVPINVAVDTANNYQTTNVVINAHNTNVIVRQTDMIHPATNGYAQIADEIWSFLHVTSGE